MRGGGREAEGGGRVGGRRSARGRKGEGGATRGGRGGEGAACRCAQQAEGGWAEGGGAEEAGPTQRGRQGGARAVPGRPAGSTRRGDEGGPRACVGARPALAAVSYRGGTRAATAMRRSPSRRRVPRMWRGASPPPPPPCMLYYMPLPPLPLAAPHPQRARCALLARAAYHARAIDVGDLLLDQPERLARVAILRRIQQLSIFLAHCASACTAALDYMRPDAPPRPTRSSLGGGRVEAARAPLRDDLARPASARARRI